MKFKSNAKRGKPLDSGTIFSGEIGSMRISVHRIIHCEGWYLSCPTLGISQRGLKSDDLSNAIEESKEVLKNVIEDLKEDVDSFCESEIEISRY